MSKCQIDNCLSQHSQKIPYSLIKPIIEAAEINPNLLLEIHIFSTYVVFDVLRQNLEGMEIPEREYSPFTSVKMMLDYE